MAQMEKRIITELIDCIWDLFQAYFLSFLDYIPIYLSLSTLIS